MNFIKRHYQYLLFCTIFGVINTLFVLLNFEILGGKKTIVILFLVVAYFILCGVGFYLKEKLKFKEHQLFLFFAIPLGLIMLFAMPLGLVPDEHDHFRRAYEISQGHFISSHGENGVGGNILPDTITAAFSFDRDHDTYEKMFEIIGETTTRPGMSFQKFGNTSLYSPVPYLPQVFGILVGRALHLPMAVIVYLVRLCNFIFWLIAMFFALKYIPVAKTVFMLIILSPISLQAAISCSADVMNNVAIIGLIAFVLYKLKQSSLLSRREKVVAVLLSLALAMSKIVYLPLCALLVLLPKTCFKSKKEKVVKLLCLLGGVTALNLVWLIISSGYLVEFQPGVDSHAQLLCLISHPHIYLGTVFHTYFESGLTYLMDAFSPNLGYFNVGISRTYVIVLLLFTFYTYLREDKKTFVLTPRQKVFVFIILLVIIALISTSLYIQWTALEATTIAGIQGRYFTALIPLSLLLITPFGSKSTQGNSLYAYTLIAAINLYACSSILTIYL